MDNLFQTSYKQTVQDIVFGLVVCFLIGYSLPSIVNTKTDSFIPQYLPVKGCE